MFSEENVLRLITHEDEIQKKKEKKKLRKSIHSGLCPPSYSTFGLKGTSKPGVQNVGGSTCIEPEGHHEFIKGGADLGPPSGVYAASVLFPLKKQSKAPRVYTLKEIKQTQPDTLLTTKQKIKNKPQVPKATERPILGVKSSMNYVKYNAIINKLSRPPTEKKEINFLKKKEYGKTPKYITNIKQQIQDEYTFIQSLKIQQQEENKKVRVLTEEERLNLLSLLNKQKEEINKEYQQLVFKSFIKTISKEKRKYWCEQELIKIEKYIDMLKSSPVKIIQD